MQSSVVMFSFSRPKIFSVNYNNWQIILKKLSCYSICLHSHWKLDKGFEVTKVLRYWGVKDTGRSFEQKFAFTDSQSQNNLQNVRKSAKWDKTRKFLYIILRKFWQLFPKNKFYMGDRILACVSTKYTKFSNSYNVQQLMRQLVHRSYYTRYQVLFYLLPIKLWRKHTKL